MKIQIENVNNIKKCEIEIIENKFNIRYGINGTGKTSISKALLYNKNIEELNKLKPYRCLENSDIQPLISIDINISNVVVYDIDYIDKYLFQTPEDIMNNSFEVFIIPKDYEEMRSKIDILLSEVNEFICNNETIQKIATLKNNLFSQMSLTSNNQISKTSKISKNLLSNGNLITNIPKEASKFTNFIESDNSNAWISWHNKGKKYCDNDLKQCPFCSQNINETVKESILTVESLYSKNSIETYNSLNKTFDDAKDLFEANKYDDFKEAIDSKEFNLEKNNLFIKLYKEILYFSNRLSFGNKITFISLKNIDDIDKAIQSKKFDIEKIELLKNKSVLKIINEYNAKIDESLKNINELKKQIGILNSKIKTNVKKNINDINDFLEVSGIDYKVNQSEDEEHVYLTPLNFNNMVDIKNNLSYGEKNAFALALFAFENRDNQDSVIILDDPISSYDINKKYAILNNLFLDKKTLRNKTVLMLTHDLEPIIDLYKINSSIPDFVDGRYLENIDGSIKETKIKSEDILSVISQSKNSAKNVELPILNRLVNLRKYLEYNSKYEKTYNYLSSIFKGNREPQNKEGVKLSQNDISDAENEIKKYIPKYDFTEFIDCVTSIYGMKKLYTSTKNRYEKLEIFRMMLTNFKEKFNIDEAILKFINEVYHIENSYLFQLNPYDFNTVPEYIITICDREINKII